MPFIRAPCHLLSALVSPAGADRMLAQKPMVFCLASSSSFSLKALQDTFQCGSLAALWLTRPLPKRCLNPSTHCGVVWPETWPSNCCCGAGTRRGPTAPGCSRGLVLAWHHHLPHSMVLVRILFPFFSIVSQCSHGVPMPAGAGQDWFM